MPSCARPQKATQGSTKWDGHSGLGTSTWRATLIAVTSLAAAFGSLEGLAVGDALGECFFGPTADARAAIADRWVPPGVWRWTDDTLMAASVVEIVARRGGIT